MYDLKNDPYQFWNLIDDPKHAAKKNRLREQLEAMRKALGESLTLKGKMPAPIPYRLKRRGGCYWPPRLSLQFLFNCRYIRQNRKFNSCV